MCTCHQGQALATQTPSGARGSSGVKDSLEEGEKDRYGQDPAPRQMVTSGIGPEGSQGLRRITALGLAAGEEALPGARAPREEEQPHPL